MQNAKRKFSEESLSDAIAERFDRVTWNISSKDKVSYTQAAIGVFFAALLFFLFLGIGTPFFTRGEGREAIIVQEMLQSENFILPVRNENDIPSKPPLFHWAGALVSQLVGNISEWSVRFPSALAASCSLALFYFFAAKNGGTLVGLLSVLILASSFEFTRAGTQARVDGVFAWWYLASAVCLFECIERMRKSLRLEPLLILASVIALACTVLAKGPAGVVLPAAVAVLYIGALAAENKKAKKQNSIRTALVIGGISLAALSISGIWYFLAYLQQGYDFIAVQLLDENLARLLHLAPSGVNSTNLGHQLPLWFAPIFLIVAFLPWSLLFPFLAVCIYRRYQQGKLFADRPYLYASIWLLTFFAVITISSSKRSVYFLSALPAVAYLLAFEISSHRGDFAAFKKYLLPFANILRVTGAIFCIALFIPGIALLFDSALNSLLYLFSASGFFVHVVQQNILGLQFLVAGLYLTAILFYFSSSFFRRTEVVSGVVLLAAACLIGSVAIGRGVMPVLSTIYSPQRFMEDVNQLVGKDPLYQYRHDFYAAEYFAERRIPRLPDATALAGKTGYLLVRQDNLEEVLDAAKAEVEAVSEAMAANGRDALVLVYLRD